MVIKSTLEGVIIGGVSGFIATLPMTLAMKSLHKQLPPDQQYPLPPRLITENIAQRAGMDQVVEKEEDAKSLTLANHFLYGAAAGAVYGALTSPQTESPSYPQAAMQGTAFGLFLWGASYLGWLPATKTMPPVTEQPVQRSLLMIGVHVVWGAALGVASEALRNSSKPFDGR